MKLLFLLPIILSAQNVTFIQQDLGLPTDPCIGGNITTVLVLTGDQTIRYGDFVCKWTLESDVLYRVKLNFIEPSQNGPALRSFNVRINDEIRLLNFDLWRIAGYQKYISKTFLVIGSNNEIKIDFQTNYRSALILSVEITSEIVARDAILAKLKMESARLRGQEQKLQFKNEAKP